MPFSSQFSTRSSVSDPGIPEARGVFGFLREFKSKFHPRWSTAFHVCGTLRGKMQNCLLGVGRCKKDAKDSENTS